MIGAGIGNLAAAVYLIRDGGWRGDKKPGKEGFGGKSRGEGFKKEGFKKGGEGFKGKRKANDSFGSKPNRPAKRG